ncbi:MAG: hypothetical protein J7L14_01210 [Candidatus Diapherotrites archaeon]|nr:hypothetical protein [Candidatus Diapherotrites archaeon]
MPKRIIAKAAKIDAEALKTMQKILREQERQIKREFRNRVVTAIVAAFGFVIAFAWKDVIQAAISDILEVLNIATSNLLSKLIAAIIISIISVTAIVLISRWGEREK